ncbi:helix-turn-helix domain-containing protein [Streptomyces sp. NPDC050610]|uniref:TetR/AcrR family transcriptional regulator n=1 Tax=Streptomyces sp. NPDC050610 TaxID=3157097 RepID=UPI00342905E0
MTKEVATDVAKEQGKRAVGRPRRLELETIVATARRVLEEEGVAALSMRRLAKEVGSTPMALYHHVQDKDELLMHVLVGTARTLPRPELPADPRERLIAVTVHMHDVLRRMPWVVEILGLGDVTDRHALWMVEEIIDSAMRCGLDERQAVRAYRTLWHYVYGELVFQAAMARRAGQPGRRRYFPEMLSAPASADPDGLPRLTALADRWQELTEDYDVADQITAITDGLLARGGGGEGEK